MRTSRSGPRLDDNPCGFLHGGAAAAAAGGRVGWCAGGRVGWFAGEVGGAWHPDHMDWTGWAIGLGLAGAAMELGGVILALREIRARAKSSTSTASHCDT